MAYKMSPNAKLVVSVVILIAIIIPILLAFVLIYPPGFSPTRTAASTSITSSTTSNGSAGAGATVTIPNGIGASQTLNFSPVTLTVAAGTTVVFVNQDTSIHNIHFLTMPTGATISPNPSPNTNTWSNNQFSVTLTVPGTYTYVCDYHSWMKATIVVTG